VIEPDLNCCMVAKLVGANGCVTTGRNKRKRSFFSAVALWLKSDKALLFIFLSLIFVSISVLLVPEIILDKTTEYTSPERKSHNIVAQLKKESTLVEQSFSSRDSQEKGGNRTSDKNLNDRNSDNEGKFFLTRSSPYHTIFSSGCSFFQDWQSYVFFYHVFQSGQEGDVTRIASGCSVDDEKELKAIFSNEIKSMRSDSKNHLHLTPDFSRVPKKSKKAYKYFNKPFGVRHWMENALGYPDNHKLHDDSIIILMDPDQIMLRPFTNDFTNSSEKWRLQRRYKLKVEHGSPFSQQYGYGLQWLSKVDPEYVFREGKLPTPVSNISRQEGFDYYMAMGPPYIGKNI